MVKDLTRKHLIVAWLATVTVFSAVGIVLGGPPSKATGAIALALCLAPAVVLLLLWPGPQARTAADVLYDRNKSA